MLNQSGVLMVTGDYVQAKAALDESLVLVRKLGDPRGTAYILPTWRHWHWRRRTPNERSR